MSVTLLFIPYNQNGQQFSPNGNEVAIMDTQNIAGKVIAVPEATATVSSAKAAFPNHSVPLTRYLGMEDANNKVIWRSGETTLDNASTLYVLAPEKVTLSSSEVDDMLPPTPIVQGDATITKLNIKLKSGKIAVDGSGSYERKVLWGSVNVNYTFTYSFKLTPFTNYINVDRIVDVVTVDQVNVSGKGILGFIVSFIANFLEDDLTKDIESTLQQEIDKAVSAQIEDLIKDNPDSNSAAGITVTVQKVTINSSGINVDVIAGIPGSAIDCPSSLTSRRSREGKKKLGARSAASMKQLRTKRDEILLENKKGKNYHQLFEKHRNEIISILLENMSIVTTSDTAVKNMLADLYDGDGKISSKTAGTVRKLMKDVRPHASSDLQKTIDQLLPEIDNFKDRDPKDVLK